MNSRDTTDIDRVFEQMDRTVAEIRRRLLGDDAAWPAAADRPSLRGGEETEFGASGLGESGFRTSGVRTRLNGTDDGYVVVADLPGFEREDIELTALDGALSIRATRELADDDAVHARRVNERVTLPGDADAEAATATYRNGVLEVVMPATGERDGRRIDVE